LAAIVNKKNEIAADVERYALTELHKATESLNCESFDLCTRWSIALYLIIYFCTSHSSEPCGGEQTDSRASECLGRAILSRKKFLARALESFDCGAISGSSSAGPPFF
jgi:hypothetical protein